MAGDEGAAVDVAREDELDLGHPLLGLRPLFVLIEVVGEVPVQIEPTMLYLRLSDNTYSNISAVAQLVTKTNS